MAFIAARMSVLRGRPPGEAGGISGASCSHSASVRLLGKRSLSLRWIACCSAVHIPNHRSDGLGIGESRNLAERNDLLGQALTEDGARKEYPGVFAHLLGTVKPERAKNNRKSYRDNWWLFAEPRREFRPALSGLGRFLATTETTKHRHFQFVDGHVVPDHMVVVVASDDAYVLGVLSSKFHTRWATRVGGWLGIGNDPRYSKSRCFDPFPFPATDDLRKQKIRGIAEELDAHRKRVLGLHPHLTLTGLYNVLERLRAGIAPADLDAAERRIFDDGLVLILKELHDRLDVAVADAYGWPADLSDEEILARLVALNQERAREEARGLVRWLRPDYQIPKFGSAKEKAEQIEATLVAPEAAVQKPTYPTADAEQTAVVMAALMETPAGLDTAALTARFRKGRGVEGKIIAVLAALHRLGLAWSDDGKTWRLRRAA